MIKSKLIKLIIVGIAGMLISCNVSNNSEIEKKTRLVKKGKDFWCCCLFHQEKTPSMKINNEFGSFYCFGCGAKGDVFTIYTDLYNYAFHDAVKELAQKIGIALPKKNYEQFFKINNIKKILEMESASPEEVFGEIRRKKDNR